MFKLCLFPAALAHFFACYHRIFPHEYARRHHRVRFGSFFGAILGSAMNLFDSRLMRI